MNAVIFKVELKEILGVLRQYFPLKGPKQPHVFHGDKRHEFPWYMIKFTEPDAPLHCSNVLGSPMMYVCHKGSESKVFVVDIVAVHPVGGDGDVLENQCLDMLWGTARIHMSRPLTHIKLEFTV